jgi:hypothetical protein
MLGATNNFLNRVFGVNCSTLSVICKQSPPYCTTSGTSKNPAIFPAACAPAQLDSFIQTYGSLYFGCHGSGWDCSGSSDFYPTVIGFTSITTLPDNPVVFTIACFDAEIPGTAIIGPLANYYSGYDFPTGGPTISQAFFASGASAFIGVTIEGFNPDTPGALGSLYSSFTAPYSPASLAPTLGQDLLAQKRTMETATGNGAINPVDSSYIVDEGYAIQLYGDPTLTYNLLG